MCTNIPTNVDAQMCTHNLVFFTPHTSILVWIHHELTSHKNKCDGRPIWLYLMLELLIQLVKIGNCTENVNGYFMRLSGNWSKLIIRLINYFNFAWHRKWFGFLALYEIKQDVRLSDLQLSRIDCNSKTIYVVFSCSFIRVG